MVLLQRVHFDSAIAADRYPLCVLSCAMCFEVPLRSSLEGVSQERRGFCLLLSYCQEVPVWPPFLVALAGETYWRVLCFRILSRRAHAPLNRIGMLALGYEHDCRYNEDIVARTRIYAYSYCVQHH